MSHFKVHEDVCLIENVKPKNQTKSLKVFPGQNVKNRGILQPLYGFQKTNHQEKEQLKTIIPSRLETGFVKPVVHQSNDLIKLKPILKAGSILSRFNATENREYEEEIWKYLFNLEKSMYSIKPNYMSKQIHLNWEMRSVLIDWLISVADEYKMNESTIHLSVNYLDRFLSNISVIREKFQLVGATALMLAGKMEEVYPPDTKEWSYLTGDTFNVKHFLKMEQLMLKILNFEMNPPTTLDFLRQLCSKHKIDTRTTHLAMYLSELVLLEGEQYLQYFPSKLAASSLLLARHTLSKPEPWPKKIEESVGYTIKQLSPVVQKQHKTFKSSPFKEQQAIQKKYASDRYNKVALIKPRILLLDDEE